MAREFPPFPGDIVNRSRNLLLILLVLSPLWFVLGRIYEVWSRELPTVEKSIVDARSYDPQILVPASPWQTDPVLPKAGEVRVCVDGGCTDIKAQPGDQVLIGGWGGVGSEGNISQITVNGVRVQVEQRGYDLAVTAP